MFRPDSNLDVSLNHVTITLVLACVFLALPVLAQPGGPGGIITPPGNGPPQRYEMRTEVKDLMTTEWTLQCPDGSVLDMTTVNLTDKGVGELLQCLGDIERAGIQISSHTVVKDFVVELDEIVSTVQMTEDQVNKIKEIIDKNTMCLHSLGYKHLLIPAQPLPPNPGLLLIQSMELGLPLRVPVVPGGNNVPGGLGQ